MSKGTVTWRGLSLVAAVLALLVGAFALGMGNFGQSYVHDQLAQEKVTMPVAAAMDGLSQADKDALMPLFAGQPLDNGEKAQAYANHYTLVPMREPCAEVKSVDGTKTFDAVPADQCTYAGIGLLALGVLLAAAAFTVFKPRRTTA